MNLFYRTSFLVSFILALGMFPGVASAALTNGYVSDFQKISDTEGGLTATIDDSDTLGIGVASIGDVDGDGVVDIAVSAYQDDDGGTARGAVHILFLNDDGTVKDEQKISDLEGGLLAVIDDNDRFGFSVAGLGDFDGDEIPDIVVGANGDDDGGTNRGAVYILLLNADGTVKSEQKISNLVGGFLSVLDNVDSFGCAVTSLGDIDGDDITDIVVDASGDDDGGAQRGAVYILFLNADGTVKDEQKISDSEGGLTTALDDSDLFGVAVGMIGDLDGDDVPDIAVGSADDDGGTDRGAVYILFLNADGTVKDEQKISDTTGGFQATLDDADFFGQGVTSLGDLDGDDIFDIAVGAYQDDDGGTDRGAMYILFLNEDGTVKAERKISDTVGGFEGTLDNTDNFASLGLASLGDLDGDGVTDIALGAIGDDDGGTARGAAYILFLAASTVDVDGEIALTEGGATDTIEIVLESEPLEQVDIVFSGAEGQATTDVFGVCFTATSTDSGTGDYAPCNLWSDAKTVTLTATDDGVYEESYEDELTFTTTSLDDSYDDNDIDDVSISFIDNDEDPKEEDSTSGRRSSSGGSSNDDDDDEEDDEETLTIAPAPIVLTPGTQLTLEEQAVFVAQLTAKIEELKAEIVKILTQKLEELRAELAKLLTEQSE